MIIGAINVISDPCNQAVYYIIVRYGHSCSGYYTTSTQLGLNKVKIYTYRI